MSGSRDIVYFNQKEADQDPDAVYLDVDNRGGSDDPDGGPETITMIYMPYQNDESGTGFYIDSDDAKWTGLPEDTSTEYYWSGIMEYYVDAFHATSSTSGSSDDSYLSYTGSGKSADATVYLFDCLRDEGEELIGVYEIPSFTKIETASVLRVNVFTQNGGLDEYYVFSPDIRIANTIRDLSLNDNGPVVVHRRR